MDPRAHVSPGFRPDLWVAGQERPRARARRWERITDVYVAVLAALTLGAFLTGIVGAATQLQRAAVQWGRLPGEAPVSGAALAAAAVVLALAGLLRLGATLGPVAVDRAQAQWWLRLPAPTAPWLWRALLLRVVAGAALGGGAGLATAHGLLYARTTAGGARGSPRARPGPTRSRPGSSPGRRRRSSWPAARSSRPRGGGGTCSPCCAGPRRRRCCPSCRPWRARTSRPAWRAARAAPAPGRCWGRPPSRASAPRPCWRRRAPACTGSRTAT